MNHKTGRDTGIHLKTTLPIKASRLQAATLSSIQSQEKLTEQNIKAAKHRGHTVPGHSCTQNERSHFPNNWHQIFAEDLRANELWFNVGDQRSLSWRCRERESFALTTTGPDTKHDRSVSAPWAVSPMAAER